MVHTLQQAEPVLKRIAIASCILVTACGDPTAATALPDGDAGVVVPDGSPTLPPPDGPAPPPPDAPQSPSFLARLDWTTTRGEPLATHTFTAPPAELFALGDASVVLRDGCDGLGCTYTWRDDDGAPTARHERLLATTLSTVSSDGRRALLLAADEVALCDRDGARFSVARGRLQLLDLATGAAELDLALRTNAWTATAFTPDDRFFFAAPIDDGQCIASRLEYRATRAPFAAPPALGAGAELVDVVDDHRWIVIAGGRLLVVDPDAPDRSTVLSDGGDDFDATGGWIHAYAGPHTLVHDILSIAPDGTQRTTPIVVDDDWFATQSFGRWARVCGRPSPDGFRPCRVVDLLGEAPPRDVRVAHAPERRDDAVLLAAGALVYVGPAGNGQRALFRLDFATGAVGELARGDGRLFPLGEGDAALFLHDGVLLLVEAQREEQVAAGVTTVLTTPREPFVPKRGTRQRDIAWIGIATPERTLRLLALDVRTHRLALLSERAHVTARAGDDCGQPGATRHGGGRLDGLIQDATQLYFVEEGEPATLYVLPIDLSAPPRRLATVTDADAACRPPLSSPDGARLGFLEDTVDGARVTLTAR